MRRLDDTAHARLDLEGPVAVVTLDRPETLNAFSARMGDELQEAWRRADADDDIRVVVVTGAGRAFCSGADFSGGESVFGAGEVRHDFSADPFTLHAWDLRKPVIAAINGPAIGLGLTLTLQCDLRIVAEDAKLGIVQTRRGVMPDARSHWSLPRLIGYARATELMLTGRTFSGREAAEWGLANEAVPADQVRTRALELALEIATQTAPVSVAVSKRLLWLDPPRDRDEIERLETEMHRLIMGEADAAEGVRAFLERRDPCWSMRLDDHLPRWIGEL